MSTMISTRLLRLLLLALACGPLPARASIPSASAYWDPSDPSPTGVIDGIYNGPTYAVQFKINGDTDGVSHGIGNNLTYLFGYTKPAANKRLSLWLTKGTNTSLNIGSAVTVDASGKWSLSLNPAQAIVAPGGGITTSRLLICEYVANSPGVNPYDKTTLYCGPWGALSYTSDYDIVDGGLSIQKQNDTQDRLARGTLTSARNTLWLCRSWVFDGPSTAQPGYPDLSSTAQDWGLNPPDYAISTYKVDRVCSGAGGPVFCDPAPSIKVNSASEGQGEEFQWVYGGLFCAGPNRTTIAMAAAYRDELTLYPTVFEGLFDNPITISVSAGCGRIAGSPGARVLAVPVVLGGLLGLARARRARAARGAGESLSRRSTSPSRSSPRS